MTSELNFCDCFLGASAPDGFHSYFAESCPFEDGWNVYIIKGGPGTGKSTLMKELCSQAQQRGFFCERVFCSSDPSSLDGVLIPEISAAVFDGTAPHVMEPRLPGAYENIINLGSAWSIAKLRSLRGKISELSAQCSQHHAQARRMMQCADIFRQNTFLLASDAADIDGISRAAQRLSEKYAGKRKASRGRCSVRLISAITPLGVHVFTRSVTDRCERVVPVSDCAYAPAAKLMEALRELLLANGHDIIVCPCAQSPERLEHIIVPSASVAFCTSNPVHSLPSTERAIHTDRFLRSSFAAENKQKLSFNKKNILYFTQLAADEMRRAKAVHDQLEDCYRCAMDFDAVSEIAGSTCRQILQ